MHKSRRLSAIPSLLACAGLMGCSSGRTEGGQSVYVGQGATGAGGAPMMTTGGTGPISGAGGMPSGTGGATTGGSSGSAGATNGGSAGATNGGSAGSGGSGGMAEEPKVVLFDGTSLNGFVSIYGGANPWKLNTDGTMEVVPGTFDIISVEKFQDVFIHIEYMTPELPADVTGQDRGNSGVYLKGAYEMQVLDSYLDPPLADGCGAVYEVAPPLAVACKPQLQWNTYEIEFKAPTYDGDTKLTSAMMVNVKLNGVLVQDHTEVPGATRAFQVPEGPGPAGLLLQDHSNTVWYRNIWAIPRTAPAQ
jgi:hypothetical protein